MNKWENEHPMAGAMEVVVRLLTGAEARWVQGEEGSRRDYE